LFLYLLGALLSVATRANDFEAGGSGAALAPVAASRLRRLTERVRLTDQSGPKADRWVVHRHWRAEVVYVFHNPTAEPIATMFAFPEDAICPEEEGDTRAPRDPSFVALETWVRGVKVPTRTIDRAPWSLSGLCLGRLHAFDLTLAPDERVEVRHRYDFSAGGGIGIPAEVVYVTRTGALWDGPIGLAEFIVEPSSVPWGLSWPAEYRFVGFEEQLGTDGSGRLARYRFEARDWTPRQDFVVTLYDLARFPLTMEGVQLSCPALSMMTLDAQQQATAGLDDATLALCRNLPYARHGFPFRRADLREALYRDFAVVPDAPVDQADQQAVRVGAPNPFYSDALLDEEDRAYLAAIAAAQARHQGGVTGPR
jgi:hypothetical protein